MKSFFRNLEREAVRYLLISGQASILYGAATFSEDVDLWIEATEANIGRFVRALHRSKAVVHKLTPPLTVRHFRRGTFQGTPMEMVFIRAPKIVTVGDGVEVLAKEGDDVVAVRQGRVVAATFHPELSDDVRMQELFLEMV